ncbi:CPBP family intramembrane glutamic endopeptidase [Actinomadura rubrisoli]|uniref:CPBP family intramembrane metalloprotease n=1 Tax=Actinomadura rubrisoli TaxID=2530368 RepID=A0A4R5A477_9ACTN|nr:type II CAAX endopeptidase family protein [Actinomadura rubrisoli]TDD66315.1 CPBP family intramembrane metalloprotease [Actinomadura rubrisoli]
MTLEESPIQESGAPVRPARPLWLFFVLAYGFTWLCYVPIMLSKEGLGLMSFSVLGGMADLCVVVGSFGPLVAALLSGSRRELVRACTRWRVPVRWYVLSILGVACVPMIAAFAVPGAADHFSFNAGALPSLAIMFLTVQFVIGALGEEPGWRGIALPRLQRRHGPLRAALILGVLWGGWHLPLFAYSDWADPKGGENLGTLGIYLLMTTALTIIMTWVFNSTGGGVFLMILFHDALNTGLNAIPEFFPDSDLADRHLLVAPALGFGLLATAVLIATRGRLNGPHGEGT